MPSRNTTTRPPRRTQKMKDENRYHVEMILDEKLNEAGERIYLVKWTGYGETETNWEPYEHLTVKDIRQWQANRAEFEEAIADVDMEDDILPSAQVDATAPIFENEKVTPAQDGLAPGRAVLHQRDRMPSDLTPSDLVEHRSVPKQKLLDEIKAFVANDADDIMYDLEYSESIDHFAFGRLTGSDRQPEREGIENLSDDEPTETANNRRFGDETMEDNEQEVSEPASASIQDSGFDRDADGDSVSEDEICNDPAAKQLEVKYHSRPSDCEDPKHSGTKARTCDRCFRAAIETLSAEQMHVYNHGAYFTLCHDCGQRHVDEDSLFRHRCKCREEVTRCCFCLFDFVDGLLDASSKIPVTNKDGRCLDCSSALDGSERVQQCASCGGLNSGSPIA